MAAAERPGQGSGEVPASSHSWRALAVDGRMQEKGKTSHLFHVLPNIKLFSPRSRCTTGPVTASEPKKCFILPAQATRSNGKVPPRALLQPPSPALTTGKALSCQYPSLDTQMLWGLRNKWNLTNCPHAPAHFLLPVPPQQGEGEGKTP